MSKYDSFEWTLLFAVLLGFVLLCFTAVFDGYYSPKLTEQDYYNKFCKKNFDVSCDNINLK